VHELGDPCLASKSKQGRWSSRSDERRPTVGKIIRKSNIEPG
jgi:hypothetical protein